MRNLTQEIARSGYSIDPTYDDAHEWNNRGFARWGRWVVYGADLGVFAYDLDAYDLDTRALVPVLLEPATTDATLTYANPVVLPDGMMFVTALPVTSYVGEQGPVYQVQPSPVLQ